MRRYTQKSMRALMKLYYVRRLCVAGYNSFRKNQPQQPENQAPFEIDAGRITAEVDKTGFSSVFMLPAELLSELVADCKSKECIADEHPETTFKIDFANPVNPDKNHIRYVYPDAIEWPSVRKIIYNATVLKISGDYLGNAPVIQNVTVWWSFPKDEAMKSNIYNFHYDIDNLKFIKLFTYLTDVDADNGPHIIFPETHKFKSLLQKRYRSVPEEKVAAVISGKKPVVMVGKSGTSFFEDTFSYHKGLNPVKPRLIFQVEYSLTNNKLG